jgi:hypothetical protein
MGKAAWIVASRYQIVIHQKRIGVEIERNWEKRKDSWGRVRTDIRFR